MNNNKLTEESMSFKEFDCSEQNKRLELLKEAYSSLQHDRVFITSREKMHSSGVELHDELIQKIADHLGINNNETL